MLQQVAGAHSLPHYDYRVKIGNREIVGYGLNGDPAYVDHIMFPFPAIRFRETTPDVQAIQQKEKGDWKKLSIEDKKALYRASFCQTYAEMRASDGSWKSIIGIALGMVALSWWMYIWVKVYVYPPLPKTLDYDRRQAQLQRMIELRVDPIDGIGSKWDYEKNTWKK